ncbi:aldehyde dehydrogenase [Candidatus Woesearchaeota archaeon]|nr:aldehyde dehydrogenase [Candidatus Woesearchaeota archaeon]
MIDINNFIAGKQHSGYSPRYSLATTFFEQQYTLPNSSSVEIGLALSTARTAIPQANALKFSQRKNILAQASANLTVNPEHEQFIVAATGMPLKHVRQRLDLGRYLFTVLPDICAQRYGLHNGQYMRAIHHGHKKGYELRIPRDGPISAFLPPNDPAEPFFVFAHAVLAGQAIIVKPSQQEPLTSVVVADALTTAGYPPGALSVVHWNTSDATRAPLAHTLCDETTIRVLMGSSSTAQSLLSHNGEVVQHGTTVQYCAGHTAAVVLPDADIPSTAAHLAHSAYNWTIDCVSTKTVIVVGKDAKQQLIDELKKIIATKKTGDPRKEETDIGNVPKEGLDALHALLHGQQTFGAITHHAPYTITTPQQVTPILCEASSLQCPLFSQEPPYLLALYACANEEDVPKILDTLRQELPVKKRMGIGLYTQRKVEELLPILERCHAHLVFHNTPTIDLNFALNHQDVFLADEFLAPVSISTNFLSSRS